MTTAPLAIKPWLLAARTAGALAVVAVITALNFLVGHVNPTTAGFVYLVAVLLIATFLGGTEAITASLVAATCFNFFFLPPVLTFTIAEPQNWAALLAFLTTALVASRLADRAREQTRQALARRQEMELLYALSRAILLGDPAESTASRITFEVARIFSFSSVMLVDARTGQTHAAGPEDFLDVDGALAQHLQQAALNGTSFDTPETGLRVVAVRLGGQPIGSLAMRPVAVSETALQSLTNLVAVTLEKVRGQELANRMETERQGEILKATLLDAIAHEFKTPLTSIKAASSALLLNPAAFPGQIRELGTIVDEEADRLGRLVSDATQMARIEAGQTHLNRRDVPPESLVRGAVDQCRSALDGHEVSIDVEPGTPNVFADSELMVLAIRHLLDNSAKYAGGRSPIRVRVSPGVAEIIIEVADQGAGIPPGEQSRIFDKFYRVPRAGGGPTGTGMGLSIVREIVRAHGGRVWVESSPGDGAHFSIALPITPHSFQ